MGVIGGVFRTCVCGACFEWERLSLCVSLGVLCVSPCLGGRVGGWASGLVCCSRRWRKLGLVLVFCTLGWAVCVLCLSGVW